ncbi:MAG TPA: hypothetical protein VN648_15670 [Candidatus Methylomirabilis sp.]|nr:hypothetical protein [Candidatus Methylomirabilis sp.]
MDPRYESITERRYSIRLKREVMFRLTYQVDAGPHPGSERWFLVGMQELSEAA